MSQLPTVLNQGAAEKLYGGPDEHQDNSHPAQDFSLRQAEVEQNLFLYALLYSACSVRSVRHKLDFAERAAGNGTAAAVVCIVPYIPGGWPGRRL